MSYKAGLLDIILWQYYNAKVIIHTKSVGIDVDYHKIREKIKV